MKKKFELYDLRVELTRFEDNICMSDGAKIWDYFEVRWENIYLPEWLWFSFYNLASIIPLLSAKQRIYNDDNDWIEIDNEICSPDVNCWAIFTIKRIWKRTFYTHLTTWNINYER